jgi:hypothetical protein
MHDNDVFLITKASGDSRKSFCTIYVRCYLMGSLIIFSSSLSLIAIRYMSVPLGYLSLYGAVSLQELRGHSHQARGVALALHIHFESHFSRALNSRLLVRASSDVALSRLLVEELYIVSNLNPGHMKIFRAI